MYNWRLGKGATYCLACRFNPSHPEHPVPSGDAPISSPLQPNAEANHQGSPSLYTPSTNRLFADCIPAPVPSPSGTPAPLRAAPLLPGTVLGRSGRQERTSDSARGEKIQSTKSLKPRYLPARKTNQKTKTSLSGLAEVRRRGRRCGGWETPVAPSSFPVTHSSCSSSDSPWAPRLPRVRDARSGRRERPASCPSRAWRPPPRTLRTHLRCAAVQRVRRPKSALGLGHGQRRRAPTAGGVSFGTSGDRRERRGAGNRRPGSGGGSRLPARQRLCRQEARRRVPRRGGAGGGAGGGDAGGRPRGSARRAGRTAGAHCCSVRAGAARSRARWAPGSRLCDQRRQARPSSRLPPTGTGRVCLVSPAPAAPRGGCSGFSSRGGERRGGEGGAGCGWGDRLRCTPGTLGPLSRPS